MNGKQLGLTAVLLAFGAAEAWVVSQVGYVGVFEQALGSPGAMLAFLDLGIALGLVAFWLVRDARDRGVSPIPYLLMTLALGSVGPLVYLIRRESTASAGAFTPVRAG
ncbi:MAG TPA: DUF2834 domain-containing protein [Candidatus Binatia bacterium]|nr:DUF2834 domain-containing protein [Candidatus Binatia bacterium]